MKCDKEKFCQIKKKNAIDQSCNTRSLKLFLVILSVMYSHSQINHGLQKQLLENDLPESFWKLTNANAFAKHDPQRRTFSDHSSKLKKQFPRSKKFIYSKFVPSNLDSPKPLRFCNLLVEVIFSCIRILFGYFIHDLYV